MQELIPAIALKAWTLSAMLPKGIHVKRCANMVYKGYPGGCAIPGSWATEINKPESSRLAKSDIVLKYNKTNPNTKRNWKIQSVEYL